MNSFFKFFIDRHLLVNAMTVMILMLGLYTAFKINLEKYYETRPSGERESARLIASCKQDFLKVDSPEFGDLVLINIMGLPAHIAIYIGEGKILHTRKHTDSVIESFDKWKKRIEGIYRYGQDKIKPSL